MHLPPATTTVVHPRVPGTHATAIQGTAIQTPLLTIATAIQSIHRRLIARHVHRDLHARRIVILSRLTMIMTIEVTAATDGVGIIARETSTCLEREYSRLMHNIAKRVWKIECVLQDVSVYMRLTVSQGLRERGTSVRNVR